MFERLYVHSAALLCLTADVTLAFNAFIFLEIRHIKPNFVLSDFKVFNNEISYIEGGTASGFYTVEDNHYSLR